MRKLTVIILVLGVILSLQGCATFDKKLPETEGTLLTQSELEKLFSNEVTYSLKSNKLRIKVTETTFPSGEQILIWTSNTETGKDIGTYRIINGQKCNKWENTDAGKERCWRVYKISETKYYIECTDGSDYYYVSVK